MLVEHIVKEPSETRWLFFDFTDELEDADINNSLVVISGIIEDTEEDITGDLLIGSPVITSKTVTQQIHNGINDTIYLFDCTVTDDSDPVNTYERSIRVILREE